MVTVTYGDSALPNDVLTAREATSTAVSLAFDASVSIVGGYDADDANDDDWNENEPLEVLDADQARRYFGEDSELHNAVRLAFRNGASEVHAIPLGETPRTETFSGQTFVLNNADGDSGIIDPRVNTEEAITVTDTTEGTDVDVTLVDGTPTAPSPDNTVNINPVTGEAVADEGSDYEVEYTEGDYETAITNAVATNVRFVVLNSEHPDHATLLADAITDRTTSFDFKRGVVGAPPSVEPAGYGLPTDDQRLVVVAPSRGNAFDNTVRTVNAVGGQLTGTELGDSATGDELNAVGTLNTEYSFDQITDFGAGDELHQVTVLRDTQLGIEIVEDLTTSTGEKFRDVYRCEIIDDVAYSLHVVADEFRSEPNTPEARSQKLESRMRSVLRSAATNSPPLLSSLDGSQPFVVGASEAPNDEDVRITVGIDVTGVVKRVEVDLSIGPITRLNEIN